MIDPSGWRSFASRMLAAASAYAVTASASSLSANLAKADLLRSAPVSSGEGTLARGLRSAPPPSVR